MAKFHSTTGVSYQLNELINGAEEFLIFISPYLKINERLRQILSLKGLNIFIVYGKNELKPEQKSWIESMSNIHLSFCPNLHAKCYISEKEAIVTSMNLYEFSEVNNHEMGIHVAKRGDRTLY